MAIETDKLFEIKNRIDDAKVKISELNGQLQVMMQQLKDEWESATIEEGEKKLKEYDKDLATLDKQIEKE
jgi:hypothetical protein